MPCSVNGVLNTRFLPNSLTISLARFPEWVNAANLRQAHCATEHSPKAYILPEDYSLGVSGQSCS